VAATTRESDVPSRRLEGVQRSLPPQLIDTRLVRAELARLRGPAPDVPLGARRIHISPAADARR
jgi:hypothetical protein